MGKAPGEEARSALEEEEAVRGGSGKSWWPAGPARQGGAVQAMTSGEPHPSCRQQKASGRGWSREIMDSCRGKMRKTGRWVKAVIFDGSGIKETL